MNIRFTTIFLFLCLLFGVASICLAEPLASASGQDDHGDGYQTSRERVLAHSQSVAPAVSRKPTTSAKGSGIDIGTLLSLGLVLFGSVVVSWYVIKDVGPLGRVSYGVGWAILLLGAPITFALHMDLEVAKLFIYPGLAFVLYPIVVSPWIMGNRRVSRNGKDNSTDLPKGVKPRNREEPKNDKKGNDGLPKGFSLGNRYEPNLRPTGVCGLIALFSGVVILGIGIWPFNKGLFMTGLCFIVGGIFLPSRGKDTEKRPGRNKAGTSDINTFWVACVCLVFLVLKCFLIYAAPIFAMCYVGILFLNVSMSEGRVYLVFLATILGTGSLGLVLWCDYLINMIPDGPLEGGDTDRVKKEDFRSPAVSHGEIPERRELKVPLFKYRCYFVSAGWRGSAICSSVYF